jgi:hypothetical protein
MKDHVKDTLRERVYDVSQDHIYPAELEELKEFLLDDMFGHELWEYLKSIVKFHETLLLTLDRNAIVTNPHFVYLLEASSRGMKVPDPVAYKWNEESKDDVVELL